MQTNKEKNTRPPSAQELRQYNDKLQKEYLRSDSMVKTLGQVPQKKIIRKKSTTRTAAQNSNFSLNASGITVPNVIDKSKIKKSNIAFRSGESSGFALPKGPIKVDPSKVISKSKIKMVKEEPAVL